MPRSGFSRPAKRSASRYLFDEVEQQPFAFLRQWIEPGPLCPKRSFLAKLSSIRSGIATDDSNLSWLQRHDLSSASAQTRSSHRLNSPTVKRANITDAQACD